MNLLPYLCLLFVVSSCSHIKYNFLNRNPVIVQNSYTKGRILIVPLLGNGSIGLYNKKGYFEKIWDLNKPTFYGELMGDKILVVHSNRKLRGKSITDLDKIPKGPFRMSGTTGIIAIYNYNGKLQHIFEDVSLHHDISVKNQKKIFALSWKVKTFFHKGVPFKVVDDSILEIDIKNSKIEKRLPLSDYFPIDKYFRFMIL